MLSTKHHPQRYAAFLAAALVIAGGALAASSAIVTHAPSRADAASADLRASTSAASTNGTSASDNGGTTSVTGGSTSRLQDGTGTACIGTCGPPAIQATWHYDSNGLGTVAVRGQDFNPGDTVRVTLDTPKSTYDQWVTVSKPTLLCGEGFLCTPFPGGNFTVTQPGIACGTNPALKSLGRSQIDALDLQNGADAVISIPTPCPDWPRLFTAS